MQGSLQPLLRFSKNNNIICIVIYKLNFVVFFYAVAYCSQRILDFEIWEFLRERNRLPMGYRKLEFEVSCLPDARNTLLISEWK
jgi:hypothetical protein